MITAFPSPLLLPLKERRTFFAEGHGRFMGIRRDETTHDRLDLVLESSLQFGLYGTIEQPLALQQGERRTAEQCIGQSPDF
jgi:hypothetical protein